MNTIGDNGFDGSQDGTENSQDEPDKAIVIFGKGSKSDTTNDLKSIRNFVVYYIYIYYIQVVVTGKSFWGMIFVRIRSITE